MKLGLFALLTICGFLIFALTMTFVPVLPGWANYAARGGFLVVFGTLAGQFYEMGSPEGLAELEQLLKHKWFDK